MITRTVRFESEDALADTLGALARAMPRVSSADETRLKELGVMVGTAPAGEPAPGLPPMGSLAKAVDQARGEAKELWHSAKNEAERTAYAGATFALELLWREIVPTQTGDGAATPPAAAPNATPAATGGEQQADESATGAATPGHAPSPRTLTCTCAQIDVTVDPSRPEYVRGLKDEYCDLHGYLDRTRTESGLCGVRHPRWYGISCTTRADQDHLRHSQHDRYGDVFWDQAMALDGDEILPAALDWPAR